MSVEKELVIGLDLGGTKLKYALGTPEGELLKHRKTPSQAKVSMEAIFDVIFGAIQEMLDEARKHGGKVIAIGMGSPGAINFETGKLVGSTPNLPVWVNADIRGMIEGKFGIPTWADNDANIMAFGEARRGAAQGHSHMIGLTLGTGIGGGILLDNKIYRGYNYAGAEIGHMSIDYNGRKCNCGNYGCIERYASATGMVETYANKKNISIDGLSTELIFERINEGEQEAIETLNETALYLGAALTSLAHIFNPQVIVIGGGVADAGDEMLHKVWDVMKERSMKPNMMGLKLVRAELGNKAGIVGAICLAAEMVKRS